MADRSNARDLLARALYSQPEENEMAEMEAGITADLDLGAEIARLKQALAERDATIAGLSDDLRGAREELEALKRSAEPEQIPVLENTPNEIQLTDPHGFMDDNGRPMQWSAGTRITNRHEIAMLLARGAEHVVLRGAAE